MGAIRACQRRPLLIDTGAETPKQGGEGQKLKSEVEREREAGEVAVGRREPSFQSSSALCR